MDDLWPGTPVDSGGGAWPGTPVAATQTQPTPKGGVGETSRAFQRSMGDTLSFGLMDRAVAAAGAGIDWASGKGFDYGQQLERQQQGGQQMAQQSPNASTAGMVAGALAIPSSAAGAG